MLKKTKPFTILYCDGTYVTFNLTHKDYQDLTEAILNRLTAIPLSLGLLARLDDIRYVVEQIIEAAPVNEDADPDLDPASKEYIRSLREPDEEGVDWI